MNKIKSTKKKIIFLIVTLFFIATSIILYFERETFTIIHRSTYKCEDQNTLKGFLQAREKYYDVANKIYEIDIQLTKDLIIILKHDLNYIIDNENISIRDESYEFLKKKFKNLTKLEEILRESANDVFILDIRLDPKYTKKNKEIRNYSEKELNVFLNKINELTIKYQTNKYYIYITPMLVGDKMLSKLREYELIISERFSRDILKNKNISNYKLFKNVIKKYNTNMISLSSSQLSEIDFNTIKRLDLKILSDKKKYNILENIKIKYFFKECFNIDQ